MTLLEEISQMKAQGISENEIVKKLQEQGASPKSINDALNQAKIKNAVSNENNYDDYEMSQKATPSSVQPQVSAKTQEIDDEDSYAPGQEQQEYAPEDYPQYQDQDNYAYEQGGMDTNTMIEISEQVFSEKIGKIQKKIDDLTEFKTLTESKIENISERTKRIESTIDKLQAAIIEKIGFYGSSLEGVKKELSMMQDSFGKIINPLADKTVEKS